LYDADTIILLVYSGKKKLYILNLSVRHCTVTVLEELEETSHNSSNTHILREHPFHFSTNMIKVSRQNKNL
jgi:hypothetical protein